MGIFGEERKLTLENLLYRNPVFAIDTANCYFGEPGEDATLKRLQRLQTNGRVIRVLRGVYATVPPGADPELFQPDPFLILNSLRPGCVFCGHSALDLHGVANQIWNRITAYSTAKAVTYKSKYATFSLIKSPAWLSTDLQNQIDRKGILLKTTSPELALVEVFRYPRRVGGIEELVKSADGFQRLDLHLLLLLLDRLNMHKLYAAVGWFLSREPSQWQVEEPYLDRLWRNRPNSPQYLERGSKGGKLDDRWNLVVPGDLSVDKELDIEI